MAKNRRQSVDKISDSSDLFFDEEFEDIEFFESQENSSFEVSEAEEQIGKAKKGKAIKKRIEKSHPIKPKEYIINSDRDESEESNIKPNSRNPFSKQKNRSRSKSMESDLEFYPGFNKKVVDEEFNLNDKQLNYFKKMDFKNIANMVANMNVKTRLNLASQLEKLNINVASKVAKERNQILGTLYFGLFSSSGVYHSMIINSSLGANNWLQVSIVLLLKNEEMIEEIKTNYLKIYHVNLETDIESTFSKHFYLLKPILNEKNYQILLKEYEYLPACNEIYELIQMEKYDTLTAQILKYHPKTYKEVGVKFYLNYGYSLTDYLRMKRVPIEVFQVLDTITNALMAPEYFYCSILNRYALSQDPSYFFPYILVTLNDMGFDYIVKRYKQIYPMMVPKNVASKYGENVEHFVLAILNNYF